MILEDDTIVGLELRKYVRDLGLNTIGPFATIKEADHAIRKETPDHAFLDVNLRDGLAFPIADLLDDHGVPYTFITSYAKTVRDNGYAADIIEKPYKADIVAFRLKEILTPKGPE